MPATPSLDGELALAIRQVELLLARCAAKDDEHAKHTASLRRENAALKRDNQSLRRDLAQANREMRRAA